MSEDEGSRANRLRNRRASRSESKTDESTETGEPSEPSKPSETGETDEPSVKESRQGTYMYLPQSQKKEIQRLYNVLKAEYEYEFDAEFEKNRAFYPLLIKHGLDGLESLDASEIQTRLDEL